ncbi:hypothetical protein ACH5RR_003134 [Cinchona calisaya]|uniref:Uncharacterized protein n=1 Tax=Cinchona calisaya TaxID=153742 RepID=A0ABD3AU34_9GENT
MDSLDFLLEAASQSGAAENISSLIHSRAADQISRSLEQVQGDLTTDVVRVQDVRNVPEEGESAGQPAANPVADQPVPAQQPANVPAQAPIANLPVNVGEASSSASDALERAKGKRPLEVSEDAVWEEVDREKQKRHIECDSDS